VNAVEAKKITEALKRLSDDERAFILNWLILYLRTMVACVRRVLTGARSLSMRCSTTWSASLAKCVL
jgi:hypothetical protein